jgi:mono/diheme cytochrome c family protein
MMKYVFVLVLLIVGAVGGVLGLIVGYRWFHNMTESPRIMPGERQFSMPAGSVSRGGELRLPKEEREAAAARKNPIASTPASVQRGSELYVIYCTPCHGPRGKGDGPVSVKFVPPADLTNPDLQKGRTDGYWHSYMSAGGAVMPSYAEALSSEERWHIVNYLRTLVAQR